MKNLFFKVQNKENKPAAPPSLEKYIAQLQTSLEALRERVAVLSRIKGNPEIIKICQEHQKRIALLETTLSNQGISLQK